MLKLFETAKAYKKVVNFLAKLTADTLPQQIALDFIRAEWGEKYNYALYAYYDYCANDMDICAADVDEWLGTTEDVQKNYANDASNALASCKANRDTMDTIKRYFDFDGVNDAYKAYFDIVNKNF